MLEQRNLKVDLLALACLALAIFIAAAITDFFDGYLARTFWMQSPEHVHFESIVEGIDPALVRAHLRDVAGEADRICRAVARTRA